MFKCASPLSRVVAVCIGAGAFFATTASAGTVSIYKVTDADGRVTYQNTPPGATAGRVERRAFDLEANAMNFARPRAVGSAPGGGSNTNDSDDVITRLADELQRRRGDADMGVSVTRGWGSVVFNDQPTIGTGVLGGGEGGGIVTPSGTLIGAGNATVGGTNTSPDVGANTGGGTGMGGGAGTGPAITNPSTGSATFSGGNQTFTGNSPTFTGNSPTFTGNSPTFTSNSATFSSNTGTLGPATPGVGAGAGGAGSFSNTDNGAAASGTQPGTPANPGASTGTTPGSNGAAQTGVAPGTNPFAGSGTVAPR